MDKLPVARRVQSTRRRASGAASLEQRNIESPFELADKVWQNFPGLAGLIRQKDSAFKSYA